MTYRDDRDATLARADALAVELERVGGERDRLKAELAHVPARALVEVPERGLTPGEVTALIADVERGIDRSRNATIVRRVGLALAFIASVPLDFARGYWEAGVLLGAIALFGSAAHAYGATKVDGPAVLETLRERPAEIVEIVETRRSLTIVTRTTLARCETFKVAGLLARLARYCPAAKVR